MKIMSKITILCIAVFFISCVPAQKIVYKINDYQPSIERLNVSVSIQAFDDIRSEFQENQVHLQAKDIIATINKTQSCINAEKLYKIPIGKQLADASCYCIYRNVNQCLAGYNEELGAMLFQEIKKQH